MKELWILNRYYKVITKDWSGKRRTFIGCLVKETDKFLTFMQHGKIQLVDKTTIKKAIRVQNKTGEWEPVEIKPNPNPRRHKMSVGNDLGNALSELVGIDRNLRGTLRALRADIDELIEDDEIGETNGEILLQFCTKLENFVGQL